MIKHQIFLMVVFSSGLVAADSPPIGQDAMREAMRSYFAQEKSAALIGGIGALAAGGTGAYLVTQNDMSHGIGYSLIGVGAIGLVVGGTVYFRTDSQLEKLEKQLETTPADYKKFEGARVARVNAQFTILKIAEISIFTGGAATAIVGATQKADLTTGIGIGLAIDAVLLFVFDYFAESRAHVYAQRIADFQAFGKNSELIQGLSFRYVY